MMKGIGYRIDPFKVIGVKPGFNDHEEDGQSAFEEITEKSFEGKWKIIYYYPKDFTFVCPTEIVAFDKLAGEFAERDAVVLGGSTDNEFCKLAWRRSHPDLNRLGHWSFADVLPPYIQTPVVGISGGNLIDQLGVRDPEAGVALRVTYIVDPNNIIQHVSANNLSVGRNPEETLRILDALQTDELCPCNRKVGGETL